MRRFLSALVLCGIILFLMAGCGDNGGKVKYPKECGQALEQYLQDIKAGDYEAAYGMLSDSLKISNYHDAFIRDIQRAASVEQLKDFTYEINFGNKKEGRYVFKVNKVLYDSVNEKEITASDTIPLKNENGVWKIDTRPVFGRDTQKKWADVQLKKQDLLEIGAAEKELREKYSDYYINLAGDSYYSNVTIGELGTRVEYKVIDNSDQVYAINIGLKANGGYQTVTDEKFMDSPKIYGIYLNQPGNEADAALTARGFERPFEDSYQDKNTSYTYINNTCFVHVTVRTSDNKVILIMANDDSLLPVRKF